MNDTVRDRLGSYARAPVLDVAAAQQTVLLAGRRVRRRRLLLRVAVSAVVVAALAASAVVIGAESSNTTLRVTNGQSSTTQTTGDTTLISEAEIRLLIEECAARTPAPSSTSVPGVEHRASLGPSALSQCSEKVNASLSPATKAVQAEALKARHDAFFACMREHGYHPTEGDEDEFTFPVGGGFAYGFEPQDERDPSFEANSSECAAVSQAASDDVWAAHGISTTDQADSTTTQHE